jgi:Kef-type K+ transport system membrane component KefB
MMMLDNHPVFVVLALAVVAPLLAEIPIGVRVPVVVLEVVLGILIGPHVLGLHQVGPFLSYMITVGMGATLFMAGMEIDFKQVRGRPLSLALRGWAFSIPLAFLAWAALDVLPGDQRDRIAGENPGAGHRPGTGRGRLAVAVA